MVGSIASSPAVDLSALPAPTLVDQPDYDTRKAAKLARLVELHAEFTALVESDTAVKLIGADAYDEQVLAQACNDAAKGVLLAYAGGVNLDHLGAQNDVARLVVTPATDTTPAVMESDTAFRQRIQLSRHSFSVAGPELAYVFHAKSAHGSVADATAYSPRPEDIAAKVLAVLAAHNASADLVADMKTMLDASDWPGDVIVTILSSIGDGVPSAEILAAVDERLQHVRPMTDRVRVQPAHPVAYAIEAEIYPNAGPDPELIRKTAADALAALAASGRKLDRDVIVSAHVAAAHVGNVQKVHVLSPPGDIAISKAQFPAVTGITVRIGGDA
ncbi:baseplate assembly protein [Sphingobium yanoikuyae]|uniref:baseplate assembly protein n=1 Tax=Sphingobium yanoikuyae TaxID=13690 RepID=UPI002FDCFF7C